LKSVQQLGWVWGASTWAPPSDLPRHQATTCLWRLLISCSISQQGVGLLQRSYGRIHNGSTKAGK
jgi:hypothetical protein